jgi:glycerol-3-phosphate acyltransferase PlsY
MLNGSMLQLATLGAVVAAYLVGSIPFGLLVARAKGVDIRAHGSGNIGATNVGRVLGRKFGVLVFALDFLKGVVAVALVPTVGVGWLADGAEVARAGVAVGCAAAAFVGHLFPVWLGFRGGRGVAVGAGAVAVLTPGPFLLALVLFAAVLSASRYMSLASLAGVGMLVVSYLVSAAAPWSNDALPLTLFLLIGGAAVVVRHLPNLARLLRGSEHRFAPSYLLARIGRELHLVALGLWLGGSVFFNLIAAPRIFDSFKAVVADAPCDRTAFVAIAAGLDEAEQARLASALAGAAVGPIFPAYFALSAVCAAVALIGALGWATTQRGWETPRPRHRAGVGGRDRRGQLPGGPGGDAVASGAAVRRPRPGRGRPRRLRPGPRAKPALVVGHDGASRRGNAVGRVAARRPSPDAPGGTNAPCWRAGGGGGECTPARRLRLTLVFADTEGSSHVRPIPPDLSD